MNTTRELYDVYFILMYDVSILGNNGKESKKDKEQVPPSNNSSNSK